MSVSDWIVVAGAAFGILAVVIVGCCWDGVIVCVVPDQEGAK
jgi:hypothetical protein